MPIWVTPTILKYCAAGLVAIVLTVGIYMKGRHDVQIKFDQYKAEVAAAAKLQADDTAKKDAKNQKLIEDTKNAYNTSVANLRAYYSLRLNKGGGAVSGLPATTNGVNDYSPDNLPSATVLASQCAETTLNLISLQNFVRGAANNAE